MEIEHRLVGTTHQQLDLRAPRRRQLLLRLVDRPPADMSAFFYPARRQCFHRMLHFHG